MATLFNRVAALHTTDVHGLDSWDAARTACLMLGLDPDDASNSHEIQKLIDETCQYTRLYSLVRVELDGCEVIRVLCGDDGSVNKDFGPLAECWAEGSPEIGRFFYWES